MKIGFAAPLAVAELLPWLDVTPGANVPVGLGGPNTTTLLRTLLQAGHEVAAVTLDRRVELPVTLRGKCLTLHIGPYRTRHHARDYFRLERAAVCAAMAQEKPDVIGAHWSYEFALGSLATGLPTVVSLNDWAPKVLRFMGWRVSPHYIVRLAMHAQSLLQAKALTANSPTISSRAARWVRRPVPVVPNAFEDALFNATDRRLNTERPLLLAGNNGFNRLKNVTTLLQAFSMVRRDLPQSRLQLVGAGYGPHGVAEAWAQKRGLANGVEFMGQIARTNMLNLMGAVDLFVHPSREESFGNVLVEAMAQGTPVIGGRNSGAVPWVLDSGRAGLLADIEDPRRLSRDIVGLLTDVQRWRTFSIVGRATSKQRFSASVVTKQYEAVLDRQAIAD